MRGFEGVRQCADYLTQDVVDWVKTNLPAAQDAKDWAIAGFSQGATCSLQIGVNHPDLFGTMIPTDSEIKPTNGSRQEMIDRFFDGDTTAYENQVPVNAIRNHAPTHQMLIIGAGEKDTTSIRNVKTIAPVAAKAGMRVAAVESSGNAHDWHAVQDVLRYGLAVFGGAGQAESQSLHQTVFGSFADFDHTILAQVAISRVISGLLSSIVTSHRASPSGW